MLSVGCNFAEIKAILAGNVKYDVETSRGRFSMRNYLVTGGAGFIGSHIAETLVKRGDQVRIFDNLSTGRLCNLDGFRDKIELIEADLVDTEAVAEAVQGVDCIFREAALASVPTASKLN
jgi:nucleoside-diphosphate-sugar epimerase